MMLKLKMQAASASASASASFRSFSSSSALLKTNRPSCTLSSRLIDAPLENHSVVGFPHCQSWFSPSFRRQWNPLPSPPTQSGAAAEVYRSNTLTSQQTKKEFDEWVVESGQEEAMVNNFEEWMLINRPFYKDGKEKIKRYLIFKENFEWVEAYNNGESKETGMTMGLNYYSDFTHQEYLTKSKGNRRKRVRGRRY